MKFHFDVMFCMEVLCMHCLMLLKFTHILFTSDWLTAFAELQTDMTDLTTDIQASGIPTLDHKTYVMKVFFPGVLDHPILQDPKVSVDILL